MNLYPAPSVPKSPDYWCTWLRQGTSPNPDGVRACQMIGENLIFDSAEPWASYYPEIRGELFFVLDDGWDIPAGIPWDDHMRHYASVYPDPGKFPSLTGTRTERLAQLNQRVKDAGWRGVGLWIASNAMGPDGNCHEYTPPAPELDAYWQERIEDCRDAGIEYWKVDWGNQCCSVPFRRMMSDLGHRYAPGLLIEHGRGHAPFNGTGAINNCRFTEDALFYEPNTEFSRFSDVVRTYDVAWFSAATTLDRIESYARTCTGIINCEDELYMGAVLGCAVGIMRYPGLDRAEEALAAVRWHRIAPAFSGGQVYASEKLLTERHWCPKTWFLEDGPRDVYQKAPAVVSRCTPLPEVTNGDDPLISFVAASLNPDGAYTVGTFGRQTEDGETVLPEVVCRPGQLCRNAGIFGEFRSLTLSLERPVRRVLGQSLICGEIRDLTASAVRIGTGLYFPRDLLESFRTSADGSETALMLEIEFDR